MIEAVSTSFHDYPQISSVGLQISAENLTDDALIDYQNLFEASARDEYHSCLLYAEQLKQKRVEQFKQGSLDMEQLASVDGLCELVSKAISVSDPIQIYNVKLSIFTSIPDFWGIGQLFPIIPIHRLDERPTVRGILSDLTCDSDGKIDKFIGGESSLPLHELEGNGSLNGNGGAYYLGMFLGGAMKRRWGTCTTCLVARL